MPESDSSRREFLGKFGAVTTGMVSGVAFFPLGLAANRAIERVTGQPAGNASYDSENDPCAVKESAQDCENVDEISNLEKINIVIGYPMFEEAVFRGLPSGIVDITEQNEYHEDAWKVFKEGSDRDGFSRKEIIGGALSSLIFGAAHNWTDRGYSTRHIPASQTLHGVILWILQRRKGYKSNVASHATLNTIAISWPAKKK